MEQQLEQYNSRLDVFRFVSAIFVVMIHILSLFAEKGADGFWSYYFFRGIFDISVPLFFGLSGYLIIDKVIRMGGVKQDRGVETYDNIILQQVLKRNVIQYLKYYLVGSILYAFVELLFYYTDRLYLGVDVFDILLEKRYTIEKVLNGTIGSLHLWFLVSAFWVTLFFYLLSRLKLNILGIFSITFFIYFFSLVYPIEWIQKINHFVPVGGLFYPAICIAIGMLIRCMKTSKNKSSFWIGTLFVIFYTIANYLNMKLSNQILLVFAVFFFIMNIHGKPDAGKLNKIATLFAKYGLGIYLYHILFLRIYNKILLYYKYVTLKELIPYQSIWYIPMAFLCGVLGPVLITYSLEGLKKQNSKLRLLFLGIPASILFIIFVWGSNYSEQVKPEFKSVQSYYNGQHYVVGNVKKEVKRVGVKIDSNKIIWGELKNGSFKIYTPPNLRELYLIAEGKKYNDIAIKKVKINIWKNGQVKLTGNIKHYYLVGRANEKVKKVELRSKNDQLLRTVGVVKGKFKIYIEEDEYNKKLFIRGISKDDKIGEEISVSKRILDRIINSSEGIK